MGWIGGGSSSPLTTKGDLYGRSTVDARIPVGSDGQVLTADSAEALGVKWGDAASGGSGGSSLIAATAYEGDTTDSTTSTTFADVDATNAKVTFTAPTSGAVRVRLTAWCFVGTDGQAQFWNLRDSGGDIAGTAVAVAATTQGQASSRVILVTGLTAGQSYTWKWGFRTQLGSSAASLRHGTVGGDDYGPLVMEILDGGVATLTPPDSVTGLSAWFDADDLALSDGAAVSSWADKTASVTVTQGTGANQPTFRASVANGHAAVKFDGSNDFLAAGTADLDVGTGDFTAIAVLRITGKGSAHTIASKDFTRWEMWVEGTIPEPRAYVGGTANQVTGETITWGQFRIVTLRRSGTALTLYDGKAVVATVTNSAGSTGTHAFTLGARAGGSLFLDAYLSDFAMWKATAISDADREAVADYFASKVGIVV